MELDDLIRAAQDLVEQTKSVFAPGAEEADLERILGAVEDYSAEFEAWLQENPESQTGSQADLESLQRSHREILKWVLSLQSDTSEHMRKFRRRAKGILAYTDVLPKRISVAKNRRG